MAPLDRMIWRALLGPIVVLLTLLAGLLAVPGEKVHACSCFTWTAADLLAADQYYDQLFVGRVASGPQSLPDSDRFWAMEKWGELSPFWSLFRVRFAVERVWKGQVPASVWVVDIDGAPCMGTYRFNQRYLVAATGPVHAGLTGSCSLWQLDRDPGGGGRVDGLGWGWTPPRPHWLADCDRACRDDLQHQMGN